MLKIFLILILMMMLVWILFQYWNQLVCNTLFTSKIIRKCFLKLVNLVSSVLMLKTIFIFLTLFTIFRTKDESFIFNLFQLVSIHCDWYYSICTFGKLFFFLHQKIYFTIETFILTIYYTKDLEAFAKCTLFFCEKPKIQKMIYTKMFLDFLKYFLH